MCFIRLGVYWRGVAQSATRAGPLRAVGFCASARDAPVRGVRLARQEALRKSAPITWPSHWSEACGEFTGAVPLAHPHAVMLAPLRVPFPLHCIDLSSHFVF